MSSDDGGMLLIALLLLTILVYGDPDLLDVLEAWNNKTMQVLEAGKVKETEE